MIFDWLKRWWSGGRARPQPDTHEMVSCRDALERLYEYMDGELDHASHEQVEEHFRICTRCYPHLRLEEHFRARVQAALGRPEVPPHLRRQVLDLLASEPPAD